MKKVNFFLLFSILNLCSPVFAQGILPPIAKRIEKPAAHERKLSTLVFDLIGEMQNLGLNAQNIKSTDYSEKHTNFLYQVDREARLRVTISYNGSIEPVLDRIRQASGEIEALNEQFRSVVAWIPFQALTDIAAQESVLNIKETERGHLRTGSVTSEGDTIHNTDVVRTYIGADGSGITVGVISDGVTNRASAQATGDLPLSINVIDDSEGGDEGTAMLEIVHDLAPGADLAFSEGIQSSTEFINSVADLADAGCNVIVDDIGYFGEPWFEEGPIATAVRSAIEQDSIVYASAAGNSGDMHYEGDFLGTGPYLGLPVVHNFGGGDWTQQIRIGGLTTVYLFLQWSEPFDGATSEYDVHLANAGATNLINVTRVRPDINDPYLYIYYSNITPQVRTYNVVIEKVSGADRRVELEYNWGGTSGIAVDEYFDLPGSVNGQPAVAQAIAAGAVRFDSPDVIEYFSSIGPSRIYTYPAYSYTDRAKPDIVAVDGNIITGAGGFGQEYPPGSGQMRFFGTSAAAPHAAACAAVIWSAYPGLLNTDVKQRILDHAVDLGLAGFDYTYGYGRIDAQQACDSPVFTVSGINGGSDDLLNISIVPGDTMAELTGYTLTADQSPFLCYLDSVRFTLNGTADAADFNNFFLFADLNRDKIISPAVDSLLGVQPYASVLEFSNLGYSFTDTGSDIILAADVRSTANPAHILDVQLSNNTQVVAYFTVNPATDNFPFDPPDISLPVELLSFRAQQVNNGVSLTWETGSELNTTYFELEKKSSEGSNIIARIDAAGNSSEQHRYTYLDNDISYGLKLSYVLYLIENNGKREMLGQISTEVALPSAWHLAQNYPNPFNPATTIAFTLPRSEYTTLKVYNILGAELGTLISEQLPPGMHHVTFDGSKLASGVYYYEVTAGDPSTGLSRAESRGSGQRFRDVKKMILLR